MRLASHYRGLAIQDHQSENQRIAADDIKKTTTLAELKEAEADWRDTVKRHFADLGLGFDVPDPDDDTFDKFMEGFYALAGDGLEWWRIVEALRDKASKEKKAA